MDSHKQTLTSAWSGMMAVLIIMLLLDPIQHAMSGRYAELSAALKHDPGELGLNILIGMLCFNVLTQVGIQLFSNYAWRTFVLIASITYGLFFLIHQVVHVLGGEDLGLHTLLDLTHHLLALASVLAAWNWRNETSTLMSNS